MSSKSSTPTAKSPTRTTEGHTTTTKPTADTSQSSPETHGHTRSKGRPHFDAKRQREVNERLNAALGVKHGN